jgi:hypothetical protein
MHKKTLLDINLKLFDGTAGGAAPAGGGSAQGMEGATPKADVKLPGSSRRAKSGAYDNVVFGKQEDAPAAGNTPAAGEDKGQGVSKSGVSTTSDALEAKRKAFKEMIEGEYKDVYAENFQQAFNRRFKEVKGMETSLSEQKPILDMLMQRYKIADGDMTKLQTAIEQDDRYYEEAADEAGLTVEQFKAMQKLERENAELKLLRQRQQGEQQAQQKLNEWYAESEKVKAIYPTFDLKAETANRDFVGLLKSGLSVQQAYELVHMEEIKAGAAQAAAQTAGEQMKARIQSRAARPAENGTSSQGAVIVKSDVHNLTRADRAEAVRRAQRGETIRW